MSKTDIDDISFDEFDELHYPRPTETEFDEIIEQAISRRGFLEGTLVLSTSAFIMGASSLTPAKAQIPSRFGFQAVTANTDDTITVPKGYNWQIVTKWGEPLWSDVPDFDHTTRGTADSQEKSFGDNNDGMALFHVQGKNILVVNNEYTNSKIIFGNNESKKPENVDDRRKGKMAHGVTVCEVIQDNDKWRILKDSPYNRRITPETAMDITGPARNADLVKTAGDPTGTTCFGTWANCGNGRTPWGTYLACEENFNGYFCSSDETYKPSPEMKRYGVGVKGKCIGWEIEDERFDISKHPNEPNRFGYVVEIDPLDPKSKPKKLTALGRFKHENAEVVISSNGHIVVYMGDDEIGEYLYKFISKDKYVEGGDNNKLLENGRLYVAKFNNDLTGRWIELTESSTGMSKEEIHVYTRLAASKVKATTMDRPEWVAANPTKIEAYCSLTNNKKRGKNIKDGHNMPVGGPNPRACNKYGQIVRWMPDKGDHASESFTWNLYVLAGNPTVYSGKYAGSKNITANNMFNSPDGLAFDRNGFLWIQTDGKYSNKGDFKGMGNNQMLVGDTTSGEIRRFLVGPKECEVTGITWSADRRTLFVGIQHPGERGNSNFPDGGDTVPRSCVIAVQRDDGGLIG